MFIKSKTIVLMFFLLFIISCSNQTKTIKGPPLGGLAAKKAVVSSKNDINDIKKETVVSEKVEENIKEDVKDNEEEWEDVVVIEEEEDEEIDVEKEIEEIEDEEIWAEEDKLPYVF